jgi:protein TonB
MLVSFSLQVIAITVGVIVSILTVDKLGAFSLPQPLPPIPRAPRPVQIVAVKPYFSGKSSGIVAPARPVFVPRTIPTTVARIVDEPSMAAVAPPMIGHPGGIAVISDQGIFQGGVPQSIPVAPPPPPPVPVQQSTAKIRVGGDVLQAKMIKRVVPVYPPLAKQARVSGTVRLQGVISREGRVINLQVISGHPLLIPSARDAVIQWVYQPTLLNGQPVEVIAPIDVHFNLSQ